VGKSRLTLEAMRGLESEMRGGVWLVGLSQATDLEDVARLAARVLDEAGTRGHGDPLERAVASLRDAEAETIVILDDCARVFEEARRVASAMVSASPHVRVLATSRRALGLGGEALLRLSPLEVSETDARGVDELVDSEAVRLFVERARAARPGFRPGPGDADVVAEICRRLDGLPLAIELAAARTNVFGLAEILSVLDRRFPLLLEGDGDATRALHALVEWSYDLLHADERTLLHQLAVHRGGASLPSLVALGASQGLDEATVIQLLGALVDKSIVTVSFPGAEARYDLLGTVRDYALQRLVEAGGLADVQRAHASYFGSLADRARAELRGPDWRSCVSRLELEHDNVWTALTYARDAPDPELAGRLGTLGWYFALAERVSEGRRFVELALATAAENVPVSLRIELLTFLCYLAAEELDLDAALEIGERALALVATEPASLEGGLLHAALALAVSEAGDEARATALADEGCAALEATGDHWSIAAGSLLRAQVAARAGDVSTVAAMAAAAHAHAGAIAFDAFRVPATLLEAWGASRTGDDAAALEAYGRSLEAAGHAGFADHASFALAQLGGIALENGDPQHAQELERRALEAAEAARAPWAAAHARVGLARALASAGEADSAEALYRAVVDWSLQKRPHQARETLFIALAGSPGAAALTGLAELAEARGDATVAADLRDEAVTRARLDRAPLPGAREPATARSASS
jgi:predicted ATPase